MWVFALGRKAGGFLFVMTMREKRSEIVRSRITPSMRQQLELDLRERSNVLSMSDYLFELVEERIAHRAIRVARQQVGKRIGKD